MSANNMSWKKSQTVNKQFPPILVLQSSMVREHISLLLAQAL